MPNCRRNPYRHYWAQREVGLRDHLQSNTISELTKVLYCFRKELCSSLVFTVHDSRNAFGPSDRGCAGITAVTAFLHHKVHQLVPIFQGKFHHPDLSCWWYSIEGKGYFPDSPGFWAFWTWIYFFLFNFNCGKPLWKTELLICLPSPPTLHPSSGIKDWEFLISFIHRRRNTFTRVEHSQPLLAAVDAIVSPDLSARNGLSFLQESAAHERIPPGYLVLNRETVPLRRASIFCYFIVCISITYHLSKQPPYWRTPQLSPWYHLGRKWESRS